MKEDNRQPRPHKDTPKNKINVAYITNILSAIGALTAIIFTVVGIFITPTKDGESEIAGMERDLNAQKRQLKTIKNRIEVLNKDEDYSDDTLVFTVTPNAETKKLRIKIDSLEKRFAKIESIILREPSEALEIPLLKREIEDVKNSNQAKLEVLNNDIERAYNIILASLAGLAISVFAPLLSSFKFKQKDKIPENKDDNRTIESSK